MASVVTSADLLALVRRSNLIPPSRLEAFLKEESKTQGTSAEFATALVKARLLTRFQAEQLLAGRCRGFFLGKYRVLHPVGSGAVGVVYLCEHVELGQRVAIKILSARVLKEDATALQRFRREARAAAALHHPNIIRTFDLEHANGVHFLVMEYIEGINLFEVVRRDGALPVDLAVHYIAQALLGLQHIHDNRMVHRDLKPSNLLLDREGTIKIHDLGLAMFQDDRHDNLTQKHNNGTILGTVDFLSPEQATNSSTVDGRTDVYSLGATLYYLLAGETPFGEMPLTRKLLTLHTGDPKPLRDVRRDVDAGLADAVARMMAREPDARYQTPLEAAHALAPFLSVSIELPALTPEVPVPLAEVGIQTRHGSTQSRLRALTAHPSGLAFGSSRIPRTEVAKPSWARRHPRLLGALTVAIVLAVVTLGGVVLARSLTASPPAPPVPEPRAILPPPAPANAVAPPAVPVKGKQILRVAQSNEAGTLRTVREALNRARPGDVIEVAGPVHREELLLQGPQGQDITLRAVQAVTWKPTAEQAAGAPLLRIVNVSGLRLEGDFTFDGEGRLARQILVEGTCPGLTLRGLTLSGHTTEAVAVRSARGEASRPIVLEGLRVLASDRNPLPAGVVFQRNPDTPALNAQHVVLRGNRFEGRLSGAVTLAGDLENVSVFGNRFFRNEDAIKFEQPDAPLKVRLTVENNTFAECTHGLHCIGAPVKTAGNALVFRRNLFVQTAAVATLTGPPPPVVPDGVKAKWIWSDEGRDILKEGAPEGDRYFRKVFYLATTSFKQARLDIAADDAFTVWVNGSQVGEGKAADRRVRALDVLPHLKAGKNLLAIRAHNDRGEAGLLAQLTCQAQDGVTFVLAPSDDTWSAHDREQPNWLAAETEDMSWKDVRVLADAGQFRSDLAWDSAPPEVRTSRLLLPSGRNNHRDPGSSEDAVFTLASAPLAAVVLPTDPRDDRTFLRYPETDPLVRLAPGDTPIGAPPVGITVRPADGDVLYRLELAKAATFSVRYQHRDVLEGSKTKNFPAGWTSQVWRPEAVGEIALETIDGVPAVAVRNLEGQSGAEFFTTRNSPVEVRAGQRYAVRVEYLLQGTGKGRFDLRLGDTSKPGPVKADFAPTNGSWRTAEAIFEASATQPLGIYVCNFGVGRDKTLFVRAVEVAEMESKATSAGQAQTVYRLRLEGPSPGSLPPPWTGKNFKAESVSRYGVEIVDGAPALTVVNVQGPASSMLFLNDLPLKAGPTYALKFRYRTGNASGQLKIKEETAMARALSQLDATRGQWKAAEYRIKLDRDGLTRFEFFNLAETANDVLHVCDVEVLDLGR